MRHQEILRTLRDEHYGALLLINQLLDLEYEKLAEDYDGAADDIKVVCRIAGERHFIRRLRAMFAIKKGT